MFPPCFPPLTAFHEMCQKEVLTVLIAFLTLPFRRYKTRVCGDEILQHPCPKNVCSLSVSTVFACANSPRIRINQITIPLVWSHKASPYSSLAQQGVLLINVKLSMPRQLEQACGLIKFEENLFYARKRKELWKASDSVRWKSLRHEWAASCSMLVENVNMKMSVCGPGWRDYRLRLSS